MKEELTGFVISDRRLWLTEGRDKLVEEGDLEAAELFATEGTRIPRDKAVKFGLLKEKKAAKKAPANREARNLPTSKPCLSSGMVPLSKGGSKKPRSRRSIARWPDALSTSRGIIRAGRMSPALPRKREDNGFCGEAIKD